MKNKTSKQTKDGVIRVVLCAIVIILILTIIVINNIPEIDNTLNYWEFIYAFVGAFLGFTSSIIVDKSQSMGVEAKKRALMVSNVKKELEEVKLALQKCDFKKERVELEIPCYEAMVQSGFLLDCIEEDYYDEMMKAYYLCNQYIIKKRQMEEHEFFVGSVNLERLIIITGENSDTLAIISSKLISAIESFLEK